MTRIDQLLVLGAGGMLGTALQQVGPARGYTVKALEEAQLDITDEAAVRRVFDAFAVGLGQQRVRGAVINAAAFTDVERAEHDPDAAFAVNAQAAGIVAGAARDKGLDLVHVSTDFVFDGDKPGPYQETDRPAPLNVYGASKLAGEHAVEAAYPGTLTVRTAWVFGAPGPNFPLKILDRARRPEASLQVVAQEVGSPTYAVDLAHGLLGLLDAGARGLYHLTSSGSCSRFTLAQEVLRLAALDVPVEPVDAGAFPAAARRPRNSVLDCGKAAALGVRLPGWRDALARYVRSLEG